jgi:hypothetical protein
LRDERWMAEESPKADWSGMGRWYSSCTGVVGSWKGAAAALEVTAAGNKEAEADG